MFAPRSSSIDGPVALDGAEYTKKMGRKQYYYDYNY